MTVHPRCEPCQRGDHGRCADVFACWCSHCPIPDQPSLDDAIRDQEDR